jgi:hypothetical protein
MKTSGNWHLLLVFYSEFCGVYSEKHFLDSEESCKTIRDVFGKQPDRKLLSSVVIDMNEPSNCVVTTF